MKIEFIVARTLYRAGFPGSSWLERIAKLEEHLSLNDEVGFSVSICDSDDDADSFSPGRARNHIISSSHSDNIFVFDADLLISSCFLAYLKDEVIKLNKSAMQAFYMYPCLYLTKEETERFDGDFQGCLESFLRGENHRVEGIALASSCLLMNREWFLQLGGV